MNRLLQTYLLQNKSVSIPGLGTIYIERIPAQSDFVNRQLIPPAYHYRFDRYFDAPAKEFFTFLAARKNIADYEAIKVYNEWALSVRNNIGNNHPSKLDGIGVLKRDDSGDIIFEPESTPKTFLVSIPAERIIRTNSKHLMLVGDRETTNIEMTDYLQEDVHREKESWWIYALIIAAAALTAIFFHYYKSGADAPFGNQQTIQAK